MPLSAVVLGQATERPILTEEPRISRSNETGVDDASETTPLVIVEGFMGGQGPARWGKFDEHLSRDELHSRKRRVIYTSMGPISSLHDRACELFYAIKGGRVDYGEDHALEHSHGRYGRNHEPGEYPQWSRDHPLHFLGHSLGGATVVKLQWLIKVGFFGDQHHPDMILSLATVSSPFRGSPAAYVLGQRTDGGVGQHPYTLGRGLSLVFHTLSYFQPWTSRVVDVHADARSLSYRDASFTDYVKQLWRSDWGEGKDIGLYDVGFHSVDEREARQEGAVNPGTFYRSYASSMTRSTPPSLRHRPYSAQHLIMPHYYWLSFAIGSYDYVQIRPTPPMLEPLLPMEPDLEEPDTTSELRSRWMDSAKADGYTHPHETMYASDGMVPVFSQWHPFDCSSTSCKHLGEARCSATSLPQPGEPTQEELPVEPGIWHVYHIENANHVSVVPIWTGSARQKAFCKELGRWLGAVDAMVARRGEVD